MAKKIISTKTALIIVNILFMRIGLLDLIFGADKSSKYYYYDDIFVRISGVMYIISSIGLWLKKDLARKTIIFLNLLSMIEVIITTNLADMNRLEGILFLSGMMFIFIGPIMFLLVPSTKAYLKNINIDENSTNDYIEGP
jgi:hypothetical protein